MDSTWLVPEVWALIIGATLAEAGVCHFVDNERLPKSIQMLIIIQQQKKREFRQQFHHLQDMLLNKLEKNLHVQRQLLGLREVQAYH